MAERDLLYRLDNPDLWIPESPYWKKSAPLIDRLYLPVPGTAILLTEHAGETRVVFATTTTGRHQGPWSAVYTGTFDLADFVVEISRVQELA